MLASLTFVGTTVDSCWTVSICESRVALFLSKGRKEHANARPYEDVYHPRKVFFVCMIDKGE